MFRAVVYAGVTGIPADASFLSMLQLIVATPSIGTNS